MDDVFPAGESILINIARHISETDVVVAYVTSDYLSRHFTEIEFSLVSATPRGKLIPVVLGLPPTPGDARAAAMWRIINSRTWFRLKETASSLDQLTEQIRSLARAETAGEATNSRFAFPREATLWYDWEDSRLREMAIASLKRNGTAVELAISGGQPTERILERTSSLAVIWTQAAKSSPDCAQLIFDATTNRRQIIYLMTPESPSPPHGADVQTLSPQAIPQPRSSRGSRNAEPAIKVSLANAVADNGGVPFHILGDKFCVDHRVAAAVADAYQRAAGDLSPMSDARLAAELAHTAVLRFRGDWKEALDVLRVDRPRSTLLSTPTGLAIDLDRLSLNFESGNVRHTADDTAALLKGALALSEWPVVISAHRLLGMYNEEGGDYATARDHLQRALHYASDLFDASPLTDRLPSRSARLALWADCLRELAALEWRSGDAPLAAGHLSEAKNLLAEIASEPIGRYLGAVIDYQTARVNYTMAQDYEAARDLLTASYQSLQRFENPLRLATILESIARLEMDFLRRDNEFVRPTLEKILRVRQLRDHEYMVARTVEAQGDLDFVLGNWADALDSYDKAAYHFNHLGKAPERIEALRSVSRCRVRLGEVSEAITLLQDLIATMEAPEQQARRAEVRSELARLESRALEPERINETTEMAGLGEFAIHDWIGRIVSSSQRDDIVIGVGDDAAVLGLSAGEDVVATTDTILASLLVADDATNAAMAGEIAVIHGLSDVIAMGGRPLALLLNLHLPRRKPVTWTAAFYGAANAAAARHKASIVGGDLTEHAVESLTVTAIGAVGKGRAVRRSGARVGELVALTMSRGPNRLGEHWALELMSHLSSSERSLLSGLSPSSRPIGLPDQIMEQVVQKQLASSAMDTTDGILACAQLMGEASGVGFEIFPKSIGALLDPSVRSLARALGIAPFLFALNGGRDWEVVFTTSQDYAKLASVRTLDRPDEIVIAVIGRVVERGAWAKEGVRVQGNEARLKYFTDEKFAPHPFEQRAREWLDYARESTRTLAPEVAGIED